MLRDIGPQLLRLDLVVVLRREHDVVHARRLAIVSIADSDLDLAIRPQVVECLVSTYLGQLARQPVGQLVRMAFGRGFRRKQRRHAGPPLNLSRRQGPATGWACPQAPSSPSGTRES